MGGGGKEQEGDGCVVGGEGGGVCLWGPSGLGVWGGVDMWGEL